MHSPGVSLLCCWLCVCLSKLLIIPVCWQVVPDSDAHRAGLQEGDQVLSVNDVDFQDIEHSRVSESRNPNRLYSTHYFTALNYILKCSTYRIIQMAQAAMCFQEFDLFCSSLKKRLTVLTPSLWKARSFILCTCLYHDLFHQYIMALGWGVAEAQDVCVFWVGWVSSSSRQHSTESLWDSGYSNTAVAWWGNHLVVDLAPGRC